MDDLSPKTRALLDAARSFDDPTDEDRDRVRGAVLMRVGSLAAAGTVAVTAAKTSSAAASAVPLIANTLTTTGTFFGGLAAKVGVAVIVAGAVASGAYVAFGPAHHAPAPAAVVAPSAPVTPVAPAPVAAAAPVAPDETPAPAVDANDLPLDDAKPAPAHAAHAHVASLEGEMKLLRTADAALRRGDSGAALSALNQEAAQYPRGALSQEREGLRVIALCSGGNLSSGQSAAQRFLAHAEKSPLASRIRSACSLGQ